MPAEIPVTFQNQREQLVGMWHAPAGNGDPAPVVVFCHGYTGHKAESHRLFVATARTLAARGVGALRFDFRGSGDSAGEMVDMTVSREVSDARAALSFVRMLPEVDESRIALLGLSLGGLVTALTLAEEPEVRAAVLWNPVADTLAVVERRKTPTSDTELATRGFADYGGWAVGVPFLEELQHLRPLEKVLASKANHFIVLGGKDESVPNADGLAYRAALDAAGLPVELHVIEEGGHTFESLPTKKEAIDVTVDWLLAQF